MEKIAYIYNNMVELKCNENGLTFSKASHQGVGVLVMEKHHVITTYQIPTRSKSEVPSGPFSWLRIGKEVTQPPRLNLFQNRDFAFLFR